MPGPSIGLSYYCIPVGGSVLGATYYVEYYKRKNKKKYTFFQVPTSIVVSLVCILYLFINKPTNVPFRVRERGRGRSCYLYCRIVSKCFLLLHLKAAEYLHGLHETVGICNLVYYLYFIQYVVDFKVTCQDISQLMLF